MAERLNFSIPEFLRTIWVSEEAQKVWEPRIRAVSMAYLKLELDAVQTGLKSATLQQCDPENLAALMRYALGVNLQVIVLNQEGTSRSYSNAQTPYSPDRPWAYRVVVARHDIVEAFSQAWMNRNDDLVGLYLGFPECCRRFYQKYWVEEGFRDLTYPSVSYEGEESKFNIVGPFTANTMLRWLGVRLVSHLPCSPLCMESETIGNGMLTLMEFLYPKEATWIKDILNWSVRWDSLHGIAIITTPVVRIVTSTDAFADRIIVDRYGPVYPAEGASGIEHPFQKVSIIKLSHKDTWSENGFVSREAMNDAHRKILDCLPSQFDTVLDVGCGNGLLLEKIINQFNAVGYGIEIDENKAVAAKGRIGSTILCGFATDVAAFDVKFDVIIVAEQRLQEIPNLREILTPYGRQLLIYNYTTNECYLTRD